MSENAPRMRLRRAGPADADELRVVLHLGEAVLGRDLARPVVEAAVPHALHAAADAAREVMVVAGSADQERLLAVLATQRVRGPFFGQALEVAVDGREPDAV